MAALFSGGPTYTSRPSVVVRIQSNTGPTTGTAFHSNGPEWWNETAGYSSNAATTFAMELPLSPEALALRKAIARCPRSRAGRLRAVARDGRIGYAPCWNRQESTPPARSFEAATTYKGRVMAELKRVRAKRI